MLVWKPTVDSLGMVLCKRHLEIARVCPEAVGSGWLVYLNIHHGDHAHPFSARSRVQAMNVADMWAAKEGDRLDREIRSVVRTGEHRLNLPRDGGGQD